MFIAAIKPVHYRREELTCTRRRLLPKSPLPVVTFPLAVVRQSRETWQCPIRSHHPLRLPVEWVACQIGVAIGGMLQATIGCGRYVLDWNSGTVTGVWIGVSTSCRNIVCIYYNTQPGVNERGRVTIMY